MIRRSVFGTPGGIRSPFAQRSPEALGAGFILPFALTNSSRFRFADSPTGLTLLSFATACRLGDENRAFLLHPSNARKRLLLLGF